MTPQLLRAVSPSCASVEGSTGLAATLTLTLRLRLRLRLRSTFGIASLAWVMLAAGCSGEALRGEVAGIQTRLQEAIANGSKLRGCAPKETANAEANVRFAEDALDMGEYYRGSQHVRLAKSYTDLALAKTNPEMCRGQGPIMLGPVGDQDGDGIDDEADECPTSPEDFDGFEDADGCPDEDNDGDGIKDAAAWVDGAWINEDKLGDRDCRDLPEDFDGYADNDGCPDEDNDSDGVLDADDQCPNDPEDIDEFEDEDGCPDTDNDKDKILDTDDRCPNQPEDYDGVEDTDGCPDLQAKLDGCKISLDDNVYFKFNKWDIDARSYGLLGDVATVLATFPEIQIEIGGHTDSKGSDGYNKNLSQKRVDSVMRFLLAKGVSSSRLSAVGYGENRPVASNRSNAGRAKNRRVEFNRIDGTCRNRGR